MEFKETKHSFFNELTRKMKQRKGKEKIKKRKIKKNKEKCDSDNVN